MSNCVRLAENEIGVSAYLDDYDELTEGEDWWFGKTGNVDHAEKLVSEVWTYAKTIDLLKKLKKNKELLFLTVPSTSGINLIPDALARKLAYHLCGKAINGRDIFDIEVDR